MAARVKVEGMAELRIELDKLRRATGKAALTRGGMKAAQPMLARIKELTPTDTHELQNSIAIGTKTVDDAQNLGKAAYAAVMAAGGTQADAVGATRDVRRHLQGERGNAYVDLFIGPVTGRDRDDVIKGYVQEFGSTARGIEPRAYIRRGFAQSVDEVLAEMRPALWAEISKAVARSEARKARAAAR